MKARNNSTKKVLIIILALMISSFIGYRFALAQTGNALKSVVEPGSMTSEASYIIFTDGSTVYARNGTTGEIDFSSANASQVINNAIGNGGRKIVVIGNITITNTILVKAYTLLDLSGANLTLAANANCNMINATGWDYKITGGILDGNGNQQSSGSCIMINGGSQRFWIGGGMRIINAKQFGIYLLGSGSLVTQDIGAGTIDGADIENSGSHGILAATWSADNEYTNLNLGGNGGDGIALSSSGASIISDSFIWNNGRYGVDLAGANFNLIETCRIDSNTNNGILMEYGSSNNTVLGNKIFLNNGTGIDIYDTPGYGPTAQNKITGNTLVGNAGGTILTGDTNNDISSNSGYNTEQQSYSYLVYTDGTTYYAKNGTTGFIDYSGTNASQVIQSTINQLMSGGKIFVKAGLYNLSAPIMIDKNHNAISIEGEDYSRAEDIGTRFIPPPNDFAFKVEGTSIAYADAVHHVEFHNFGISIPNVGHTVSGNGIELKYVHGSLLENIWMWNLKGYGLYMEQDAEGKFDQVDMRYCGDPSSNSSTLEIVGDGYTNHLAFTRLWIGQPYYYGLRVSSISSGIPQWISIIQGFVHGSGNQGTYGMLSNYSGVQLLGVDNFYMQDMYIGDFNGGTLVNITDGLWTNFHVDISRCHFQLADSAINSAATFGDIHDNYFVSLSKSAIIVQRNQHDIHDNYFYYPYYNVNNTYSYIVLNSSYNLVKGNYFYDGGTTNQSKYSVEELAGSDYNRIEVNNLYAGATAKAVKVGSSTAIKDNNGYVTENSGNATVSNNDWIAHGLATTPTIVTLTPSAYNVTAYVLSTNSTHIKIGLYYTTTGTNVTSPTMIYWHAEA